MKYILIFILLLTTSCSSDKSYENSKVIDNTSFVTKSNKLPLLLYAKYTKEIISNDKSLRKLSAKLTSQCNNNIYCKLIKIFNFVQKKQYLSDPVNNEFVQSPEYTLDIDAGDCEDLAILYVSLLRNIGLESYLVAMDGHMLASVCGINKEEYITTLYKTSPPLYGFRSDSKTIQYPSYYYMTINNDYTQYPLIINIKADKPVDINIYKNKKEYQELLTNGNSMSYLFCNEIDIKNIQLECELEKGNIFNIKIKEKNTKIIMETHISDQFISDKIITFKHNDKECIYVDPTIQGQNTFPGYLSDNIRLAKKHLLFDSQ